MPTTLLNLISTPIPVLNSLGLTVRVGLSSEDPKVMRQASEAYDAFLTVYSPEGVRTGRHHLGQIPPNRRRFFNISDVTRNLAPGLDHLVVVHRVPSTLLSRGFSLEDEIDSVDEQDYFMYRSLIEYSYPGGGNGSVIYETPPRINAINPGNQTSNTLTFSSQTVISETLNTFVVLLNYSVDPPYSNVAHYEYGLYGLSGDQVATGYLSIGPFGVGVIDVADTVPQRLAERERDPHLGLSTFNFVGSSSTAALQVLFLNVDPSLGAVAVEHTHPAQAYILPFDQRQQRNIKTAAQRAWQAIFSHEEGVGRGR